MQKYIHQFKKGDIVHFYGARFEILEDAHDSGAHRPMAGSIKVAHGPSECAIARSICIDGQETRGYIEHGKEWTFQGNFKAGTYEVESSGDLYEITDLSGKVVDTVDYATASRLYGSVQYGWRKHGSSVVR